MVSPWEEIFRKGNKVFVEPHPDVIALTRHLAPGSRVLDLGCGAGRHLIYLGKGGFQVYGVDSSSSALQLAREWLESENLTAALTRGDMRQLPYPENFFGAVISIQVIHHNRLADIRKTVHEVERVLVPQGLLLLTVPVSQAEPSTRSEEIEPGTFLPLNGPEKGLLHHYFSVAEFRATLADFEIEDLHIDNFNHYVARAHLTAKGVAPRKDGAPRT